MGLHPAGRSSAPGAQPAGDGQAGFRGEGGDIADAMRLPDFENRQGVEFRRESLALAAAIFGEEQQAAPFRAPVRGG